MSAPSFRIWPPVAIAVPWLVGWAGQRWLAGPTEPGGAALVAGWFLLAAFALWNGTCLVMFARRGTGLLPGQETTTLMESGPYRLSRNPLYVGLLAAYAGLALAVGSWGALALLPVAWAGLQWGAVLPEERYLRITLGEDYERYRRRVRRWI